MSVRRLFLCLGTGPVRLSVPNRIVAVVDDPVGTAMPTAPCPAILSVERNCF